MLHELESVRRFAGLRPSGPLPDETTIPKFRRLLVEHGLGERLSLYMKRIFGYGKVRYRSLAKNHQRLALLGFANLLIAGRYAAG